MPAFALPVPLVLAAPVDEVRAGAGWALEPKWDGWRAQTHTGTGRVWSRHGTDLSRPSKYNARGPAIDRTTYKATISINMLTSSP